MTRLEAFCESLAQEIEYAEGDGVREIVKRRVRAFVTGILDDHDTEGLITHKLDELAGSAMDNHPLGRG